MQGQWLVRIWGTRGSFPAPDKHYIKYGGNTCCLSIETENLILILDAGSGITDLYQSLDIEKNGVQKRIILLISHLHIDHVCGLFMCPLLLDEKLCIYGPVGSTMALHTLLSPPYWPVCLFKQVQVHELAGAQSIDVEGLTINTLPSLHPGGGLLYRISDGQRSLSYALDCELTQENAADLCCFAQKSNLLIWDASYEKKAPLGWGHSSIQQGDAFSRSADIGKVVMTHYRLSDDELDRIHSEYKSKNLVFAREGMVIKL